MVIAIVPVKLSQRLPGKHMLKIGGTSILESVVKRISTVMEVEVYSKIDISFPHLPDSSSNIMELVSGLSERYGTFMLVGGDMPFFTVSDVRKMLDGFHGRSIVPRHHDGKIEPLFAIYSGKLKPEHSLIVMIARMNPVYIDASKFSKYAFFNINTEVDYEQALEIMKKMVETGKMK
ncbi:MAG: hypothetical protein M1592_03510 [Candidatus Thermoplasmatota archaeon]|nr:hypothetical protein [Candidatus Thermoplasmatota archaeon]